MKLQLREVFDYGWRHKSLGAPTIIRERNLTVWEVLAPAISIAVASFFMSVPLGIFVTFAAGLAIAAFITHRESSQEELGPVVLEIGPKGMAIKKQWVREVEIPWQDVEAMQLSRGGKGAVNLDIRVTEPKRYLGRFMHVNLALSRYHVSIRVSGLELSPKEIALTIEDAQKAFPDSLRISNRTQ